MTAADETLVARRAGAMCIAAGAHGEPCADWPCDRHFALARRLLGIPVPAPASNPAAGGPPAPAGAGFDGAADRDRRSVAAPPSAESNRPGTLNPRAAVTGHRYGPQGA